MTQGAITRTVKVELGERSYPIYLSANTITENFMMCLAAVDSFSHLIVIADAAVRSPLAGLLENLQRKTDCRITILPIPSGESSKSIERLKDLWEGMYQAKADRASLVVAVGGGVVGDLAGFAAATYARGLRFLQVPTTLLAMVDSSVGGKTGINLPHAKNMVGAFWQPSAVSIDTHWLATLPDREYRSGIAEIVKYGVILDPGLFSYLEANAEPLVMRDPNTLIHVIARSCELKAHVVQNDERETTGLRAILNYGHTFAHAIEAATEYGTWLHGEAVSIGMTMAARLAVRNGWFSADDEKRQRGLLQRLALPTALPETPAERLWELMQQDKKVDQGKLRFIIPSRLGQVELRSGITKEEAIAAMVECSLLS